jgi:hypothetical protein
VPAPARFAGAELKVRSSDPAKEDELMGQKLTMKSLSEELETLRKRLHKLESRVEHKLDEVLEQAAEVLKSRIERGEGTVLRTAAGHGPAVDTDARRRLIEKCAYLRAERRGFVGGDPQQDWLEAEMEIDQLLLDGWIKPADEDRIIQGCQSQQENRV